MKKNRNKSQAFLLTIPFLNAITLKLKRDVITQAIIIPDSMAELLGDPKGKKKQKNVGKK
ncbi:MAG: hypothetical protein SFY56_11660 [Bacteroidota bacterium]|nr:hypothetical protein [Bacteroidota bacterium]